MRAWYQNLSERDRNIVTVGGIVLGILLILALVLPLNRNIAQARQRVFNKQTISVSSRAPCRSWPRPGRAAPTSPPVKIWW
jgi:type II secretory pathway component PulM